MVIQMETRTKIEQVFIRGWKYPWKIAIHYCTTNFYNDRPADKFLFSFDDFISRGAFCILNADKVNARSQVIGR